MRIRFTQGIAADRWHYEPGEVVELPDELALTYVRNRVAVEAEPRRCPHCQGALDEPTTVTPPAPLEAATSGSPRRRG